MIKNSRPKFADESSVLIDALEKLSATLHPLASEGHAMIVPSAMQGDQAAHRLHVWTKAGKIGPMPELTLAEQRSTVYVLGATAAKIRAFISVNATSLYELSEESRACLSSGRWLVAFGNCRGLLERIAIAVAFRAVIDRELQKRFPPDTLPNQALIDFSEAVNRFLYGTRRNWTALVNADYATIKRSDAAYKKYGEGFVDLESAGIMNKIEKMNLLVPGTTTVYEILCDFLHPNCGDLFATTIRSDVTHDEVGTKLLCRTIGLGSRSFDGTPELDVVMAKICPVIVSALEFIPKIHEHLLELYAEAQRRTQKFQRRTLKKQRGLFSADSVCPCLSGRSVRQCCGRY